MFLDGVYQGVDAGSITEGFDLQAIEVLRGPLAQLYGNAAGGVVQVFTDMDAAPSAAVTAAIGIAAAGAGAVARNTSSSSIAAKIDQGSTVTANQALTVQAIDTSEAHADLLSLAISGGLLGLSIGVGIAQNLVEAGNTRAARAATMHADADRATVSLHTDVAVDVHVTVVGQVD